MEFSLAQLTGKNHKFLSTEKFLASGLGLKLKAALSMQGILVRVLHQ